MTDNEQILWEAKFNPKVRTYWLLSGALILLVRVVGIPLIPIWFAAGHSLTGRYLRYMRYVLTKRTLQFSKGMFILVEKTVPLDKITDLGIVHGPIMRYFDLRANVSRLSNRTRRRAHDRWTQQRLARPHQ